MMNDYYLFEKPMTKFIRFHLEEAVKRYPSDKELRGILFQLDLQIAAPFQEKAKSLNDD